MAYLNDLWYADPNNNKLYTLINDVVNYANTTSSRPSGVCVDINKCDIWVTNSLYNTVTRYTNGVKVIDIPVGNTPMGICQGAEGIVYVTNYSDNTITKIEGNSVVKTITVGSGPRGICVTKDGTIWVANYLSSTVSKIINDIRILDIAVSSYPIGICADQYNSIYTANSVAGTVSKIIGSSKVLDITVGKVPSGICCDKSNNIWVSNYNSSSVSKITDDAVVATIDVGAGPFGISTVSDGSIYVFNYLGNSISKISSAGKLISNISTCNNPTAFGDFSGYQAYFMLVVNGSTSSGTKISFSDLDDDLQTLIKNGFSGTSIADTMVTHDDTTYSTVNKALNKLLYTYPMITSFSNSIAVAELGSVITSIKFTWALNKDVTLQTITDLGTIDASLRTLNADYTNNQINTDKSWTLNVTDSSGTMVSAISSLVFLNKIYWGSSSLATINTSTQILALPSEDFYKDYNLSTTIDCTGGKYIYFAVPSTFGLDASKFIVDGLTNNDWTKTTIIFTNASGYTSNYDIFKSNNLLTGAAINVKIGTGTKTILNTGIGKSSSVTSTEEATTLSKITANSPITYDNENYKISHDESGVTAGVYSAITVDKYGHIILGSNDVLNSISKTPTYVRELAIVNGLIYIATGISAATDWTLLGQTTITTSITSAPLYIGQMAIVGTNIYIATGTSATTDWKQITN